MGVRFMDLDEQWQHSAWCCIMGSAEFEDVYKLKYCAHVKC